MSVGFLGQLLALAAPGARLEWDLAAADLAAPLAMGPAGLLLGLAASRGIDRPVDVSRALVWSGLAAAVLLGCAGLSRTPTELGALFLLAAAAAGFSINRAGSLVRGRGSATAPGTTAPATMALLAAGGGLACWLASTVPVPGWRSLLATAALAGLVPPLALLAVRSAAPWSPGRAPEFERTRRASAQAPSRRATFGTLVGASHVRGTLSLCAVAGFTAMAAGMAVLLVPMVFGDPDSSRGDAAASLGMLHAAAAAGALGTPRLAHRVGLRPLLRGTLAVAVVAALVLAAPAGAAAASGSIALLACGFTVASAQASVLLLAPEVGPEGAHGSVPAATAAFIALGAVLGVYAGSHAWTAAGIAGFHAAWGCALAAAALSAAAVPAPRSLLRP